MATVSSPAILRTRRSRGSGTLLTPSTQRRTFRAGILESLFTRPTIDLPDDVLRRAKIVAIERGSTLKRLVIDALTHEIEFPSRSRRRRLSAAPIKLAEDSPLRVLGPEEIKRLDEEAQQAADSAAVLLWTPVSPGRTTNRETT